MTASLAFDAFLCRAWGETDMPSAELVRDWEGVRCFLIREWLGVEEEEELVQFKEDFDNHEADMGTSGNSGPFSYTFEIGGVSVERVCGFAHPAEAMQYQASDVARDVLAERCRQVDGEGWTAEHDDSHVNDEIAAMACFYAMPPGAREWTSKETGFGDTLGEAIRPEGWAGKVGDRRRELVKAAALAIAEIERLDRAAVGPTKGAGGAE